MDAPVCRYAQKLQNVKEIKGQAKLMWTQCLATRCMLVVTGLNTSPVNGTYNVLKQLHTLLSSRTMRTAI